jgi:hypothetical protein
MFYYNFFSEKERNIHCLNTDDEKTKFVENCVIYGINGYLNSLF